MSEGGRFLRENLDKSSHLYYNVEDGKRNAVQICDERVAVKKGESLSAAAIGRKPLGKRLRRGGLSILLSRKTIRRGIFAP